MTSADKQTSHSTEWLFFVALLSLAMLSGCARDSVPVQLGGPTMGTTWSLTYVPSGSGASPVEVQAAIEQALDQVNLSMSTYRDDSEIVAVNRAGIEEEIVLSRHFLKVLEARLQVGSASEGAYDVTVGPLVRLWGFGPEGGLEQRPSEEEIAERLSVVGQSALALDATTGTLVKRAQRELDFSSVAKGYAVDLAAEAINALGESDYLLEVGGEMRLSGQSPRGDAWRVAIEQPDVTRRQVATAIPVTDAAVATSGDYRNFFELEGERYSHSIDPRTGRPVRHDLVSVTVVHQSTMLADAWATALIVLGMPAAREVAEGQGLAVYFIQREGDDYIASHSSSFAPFLAAQNE